MDLGRRGVGAIVATPAGSVSPATGTTTRLSQGDRGVRVELHRHRHLGVSAPAARFGACLVHVDWSGRYGVQAEARAGDLRQHLRAAAAEVAGYRDCGLESNASAPCSAVRLTVDGA